MVKNLSSNTIQDKNFNTETTDAVLLDRWQFISDKIANAVHRKQSPNPVKLIAVSKTKPIVMIETLLKAGQTDFGENYLQEALPKIEALKSSQYELIWHYIGHIQRNKTRDIAENFDWVHTIERDIIAKRLNNQRPDALPALNVLIQVNIDNEPSKSGCLPTDVDELVNKIKTYERLNLRGLMIIPEKKHSSDDDVEASAFARTKQLFDEIEKEHKELKQWDTLSMGMSSDMEDAIMQGATMVRVGSAIFGARDTA